MIGLAIENFRGVMNNNGELLFAQGMAGESHQRPSLLWLRAMAAQPPLLPFIKAFQLVQQLSNGVANRGRWDFIALLYAQQHRLQKVECLLGLLRLFPSLHQGQQRLNAQIGRIAEKFFLQSGGFLKFGLLEEEG